MKKVFSLLLVLFLAFVLLPVNAEADTVAEGTCGDNLTWTLDDQGTLTISGTGAMWDFKYGECPWTSYRGSIKTVSIGNGVTSIGDRAFYECSSLTDITIPNSIASIGYYAFVYCISLTDITIPNSVTDIGGYAFVDCSSLKSITIGDSVTSIGHEAFSCCGSLTDITIPDSVTSIGDSVFTGCYSLTKITVDPGNEYYCSDLAGVLFDKNKTELICAPAVMSGSYTIPGTVIGIADYAFYGCSSLTSITIPNSVTSIGCSAFNDCSSLTSITIPDFVTSIGDSAFFNCSSLTDVTIPNSVTDIGGYAFSGCRNLTKITVDPSNGYYSSDSAGVLFDKNKTEIIHVPVGISGSYTIPGTVTTIDDHVFAGCISLTDVTIPNSVTDIGYYAFNSCSGMTKITVDPDNGYYCSDSAGVLFDKNKTEIIYVPVGISGSYTIPNTVTSIDHQAFTNRSSLTSVTIPTSVTSINVFAFSGCTSLTSITIPASVTTIGNSAFSSCSSLSSVIFCGDAPVMSYDIFKYVTATAYYPAGNTTWTSDVMKDYLGTITWVVRSPVEITQQPQDACVRLGEKINISVEAVGEDLTYDWYVKDVIDPEFVLSSIKTATYAPTMTEDKAGRYSYCVITDKHGNSVTTDTVRIWLAATITQQPVSVTVAEGEVTKVTVGAVGEGLSYRWYYKNAGESSYSYTSSFKGNTYSVTMNEARNGRRVLCRVYDKYGNVVQSNTVKLSMTAETLKITQQPVSVTVAEGETAKVTVKATGNGLTYRWYYKNAGESSYTYTSSYKGNTYSVPMNADRNGRQVLCRVYDAYGNVVQTNTVMLSMTGALKIVQQPKNVTAAEGVTAKTTVLVSGQGVTYQWYYANPGSTKFYKTAAFTGRTYYISMNDARNGRSVYCVITDQYGNTVTTNTITLNMS